MRNLNAQAILRIVGSPTPLSAGGDAQPLSLTVHELLMHGQQKTGRVYSHGPSLRSAGKCKQTWAPAGSLEFGEHH